MTYHLAPNITAFSTERHASDPSAPYDGFNVTHYSGDDPAHVAACRAELCQQLGVEEQHLIIPRQIHGTKVAHVTNDNLNDSFEGVDALTTDLPNTCIGISTADCVPILLHDSRTQAIAAIHAGWRGTVARIASRTLSDMSRLYGTNPSDVMAIIGPSIGPEAFEVGDEVYEAFAKAFFPIDVIAVKDSRFPHPERWHIDLWQANAWDLVQAGLSTDNVSISGLCTHTHFARFFSARRLGINSGRMFTGIVRHEHI